jgi:ATP-dependent phosphoenolpyruvate carboxykinase
MVCFPLESPLHIANSLVEVGSAITSSGALSAYSGTKTGRSPSDKRVVKEPSSENDIWWGPVNKPMTPEVCDSSSSDAAPHMRHFHCRGFGRKCRSSFRRS